MFINAKLQKKRISKKILLNNVNKKKEELSSIGKKSMILYGFNQSKAH